MASITLAQSGTNNGTATPATPGSLTTTAANLLALFIAVQGTSPTITTPGGWTSVQNSPGASLTAGLFILPNNAGGATNPSATLGGTVAGWIAIMAEITATGANEALISSAVLAQSAAAQLANVFPTNLGQAQPTELFFYAVARLGNITLTGPTSGLNAWAPPGYTGASQWSASVQGQTNVRGLSVDLFWGDTAPCWPCPYPQGAGLMSSAVASVQIGAWLNSAATYPDTPRLTNVGGYGSQYTPPFFQGMIGG